ncbi:hypothetical protein HMPREF9422_0088 [Streptococcus cristatus ATCC 51100]|nr:hypothetical protein HMPREF9422_0088 [Streptococcus cristatus ATCC 51100]
MRCLPKPELIKVAVSFSFYPFDSEKADSIWDIPAVFIQYIPLIILPKRIPFFK